MNDTTGLGAHPTEQMYEIYIRATDARIWAALTTPEDSSQYLFGARVETTGQEGEPFRYHSPDGTTLWGDDTVLLADPPRQLVVTYRGLYDPALADEPDSRVTWTIRPDVAGICVLSVRHDRLEHSPRTAARVSAGWMRVLSGLKTLLETGAPLD
jgi:uncharacterized protein YndB with AHSA1/START domain